MSSESRIVLVTGGAGFVGSHLVDELVGRSLRVRVLDSLATGKRSNLNPRADVIESDIRDLDAIRPAFEGVDCVFHTAAMARVPLSIEKPLETHAANATGTLNVLVAARDAKVRRVVNSGSSSVYGDQPSLPLHEDMAPNPLNPYALQKMIGEYYTRQFHQLYGMQTLTLRYFNVYGPRMTAEGAYLTVISIFLRQRKAGEPLTIDGDGEQTRDFTHVHDVVRANILAMDCETADGRAINIGAGNNVSINAIAGMIGGPLTHRAPRRGDARNTLADNREAAKVLGWHPAIDLRQGIEELIQQAGLRA
jgi:nucleoside-diphosphate-sugar epimerase